MTVKVTYVSVHCAPQVIYIYSILTNQSSYPLTSLGIITSCDVFPVIKGVLFSFFDYAWLLQIIIQTALNNDIFVHTVAVRIRVSEDYFVCFFIRLSLHCV